MADETLPEVKKPEPKPFVSFSAPEPTLTATDRLRAFEDEKLGKDAVRINDRIERGSGSFFKTKLTDADRAQHAALEKLVEAEQKLADAHAALIQADADHEAAEAAVNA